MGVSEVMGWGWSRTRVKVQRCQRQGQASSRAVIVSPVTECKQRRKVGG